MFVALRDLAFAKGRFLLIGAVVALITILVGFLSGLTGGLAQQNVSAVLEMPGSHVVLSEPEGGASSPTFADSAITQKQAQQWQDTAGVTRAQPIGISQTRAETGDTRAAVAAFGVQSTFGHDAPTAAGTITLSAPAAKDLGVTTGGTLTIAGTEYRVGAVTSDLWYSHTPVTLMTLGDWQAMQKRTGSPDAYATVLAVDGQDSVDYDAVASATHTVAKSHLGSLTALSSFRSEIGSLMLMVALLFGISALVIGAFFTVWTMQRTGDIAVLKALGASTASLVKDALGQALIVLTIGIGLGIAVVAILGSLAGSALPFLLSPLTTVVPGLIMIALGLAGAAFALRSVTSADPLTALGSNR